MKLDLRPLQRRHVVTRSVVSDANQSLIAPMANVREPGLVVFGSAESRSAFPCAFHRVARRCGKLLLLGTVVRILSQGNRSREQHQLPQDK